MEGVTLPVPSGSLDISKLIGTTVFQFGDESYWLASEACILAQKEKKWVPVEASKLPYHLSISQLHNADGVYIVSGLIKFTDRLFQNVGLFEVLSK